MCSYCPNHDYSTCSYSPGIQTFTVCFVEIFALTIGRIFQNLLVHHSLNQLSQEKDIVDVGMELCLKKRIAFV